MMFRWAPAALVLGAALGLGAARVGWCGDPIRVTDDVGREVALPAPPRRIVSTTPSNTEALFALGVGDRVVGVTTFCVHPEEAKTRKKIGDFSSIDFETLLALEPDLVVATWLEQRRHVERMEALGLEVFVVFPQTLEGTMGSLERLGQAVGAEAEAGRLVADMKRRLAAVDEKVAGVAEKSRPVVLIELGLSPLYTAGPGSTVDEVVRRAGGRNLAHDLGKPYATISKETVIARDPDLILAAMGGEPGAALRQLREDPALKDLRAVRAGHVRDDLDPAILVHENHRLVEGVERLYALLHRQGGAAPEAAPPADSIGSGGREEP